MTSLGRIATAAALLTVLSVGALMRVSAINDRLAEPVETFDVASSVPSPDALRLLALGHDEAAAAIVWLNALSFYGEYYHLDTDVRWLDPHIEAVIQLDPRFRIAFEWAGSVIMYGGEINNESILAANRFLARGVQQFPYDWVLRLMLGVNYAFELIPSTPEEREEWRRFGAEQIAIAAGLPNAPPSLRVTAASMMRRLAAWSDRVRNLEEVYLTTAPANARTLRAHLEASLSAEEALALVAQRQLTRELANNSTWGAGPIELVTLLHPDPLYLYRPTELPLPSFPQTR